MKKLIVVLAGCILTFNAFNQVFNTASTLKKGTFSLGIEPLIYLNGGNEFYLFFHGGYGLKPGIDLALELGVGGTNYIGGNLEWRLRKNISLVTGAHSFGDIGLDGSLLFNIPIKNDTKLYTGGDLDVVFADEILLPVWIPIGVDIRLKRGMSFLFEAEIGLNDPAYHVLGGGLMFYF